MQAVFNVGETEWVMFIPLKPIAMKKLMIGLLLFTGLCVLQAQEQTDNYQVFVNLNDIKNDKLQVDMVVPKISERDVEFHMPKTVPGTYSISDFGRFLSDVRAFDIEGNRLEVSKISTNRWKIKGNGLYKLSYWVEDTYDSNKQNPIFEPSGTNFEAGVNFVLNTFGFVGYLDGYKENDFEVNVTRPVDFYGATSLPLRKKEKNTDQFYATNYFNLHDAPIMYCKPDTVTMKLGGAEILVSVYSPGKVLTSQQVMDNVSEILVAQKDYLGGELPVDKYAFIIYLFNKPPVSGAYGALEHSYSSMYSLPEEVDPGFLSKTIRDIAAHEFFHIVTPLNIHSEEVGNFNFIDPQMSKHLWMYEGATEYAAYHVQVKSGLITQEEYLKVIEGKMQSAAKFNESIPFTEMSKGCLKTYKDQYTNVYQKGALISMCVDLKLRILSKGAYGIQNLMKDLAKTYGKDVSFKDDELFDKITALTYPEMRPFFAKYVEGNTPLPFKELLGQVGIDYKTDLIKEKITLGDFRIAIDLEKKEIYVQDASGLNDFGKKLGIREGDVLESINGIKLTAENIQETVDQVRSNTKKGKKLKLMVIREDESGKPYKKRLKAKTMAIKEVVPFYLELKENPTAEEVALRKAWINQ